MLFWLLIRSVLHPGGASFCARWRSIAILPLPERTSPACRQKHAHPVNVVRQIAQTDLCSGSGYADRAQQHIPRSLSLHTEDVLDPRTDPRPGSVAFLFSGRQWTIAVPLALDVFAKTILRETLQSFLRSIGRIRPYVLARIVGKELLEYIAVVQGRIGHDIASNQLVLHIHRDVVLVAVKRLAVLLGPARIHILSSPLVLWPVLRDITLFDPGIFLPAVPLLGYAHDAGIHDLPFHRHETVVPKVRIEGRKQLLYDAGLDEVFPKTPDGGGVGDLLADVQTKKATKGVPVENVKLGRVIRQIVQRLQDKNLEQQDDIVPLGTNCGLPTLVPGLFKRRAKHLPVDRLVDLGKRVAVFVDFVQSVLQIKKSGLDHGWSPSGEVVGRPLKRRIS